MAEDVLQQDSGKNFSEMTLSLTTVVGLFGFPGYEVAEAVKFTSPRAGWKLEGVQILGWDGFNGTIESLPSPFTVRLDVRDAALNLLYTFTDDQIPYFNTPYNATGPVVAEIDLPSIPVSGDFYVCFYDRGSVVVGAERENPTGNSYFFNRNNKELIPAELPSGENETLPVNWIIRAVGQ